MKIRNSFLLNEMEDSERIYLAPEILAYDEHIQFIEIDKLDVFSLGVLLFISEFKQPPFKLASNRDPLYRFIASKNPSHND